MSSSRSVPSGLNTAWLRLLLVGLAAVVVVKVAVDRLASPADGPSVTVVQTDGVIGQRMARLRPLVLTSGHGGTRAETIRIDSGRPEQTFWGVGAAVTDSSAYLIQNLPAAQRTRLLSRLYGRAGLGLSFGAIPIGASDYTASGEPYTDDDLAAGRVDPQLAHFSLSHDERWNLPVLEAIARIQPAISFFATTWTAPPWMKANDAYDDVDFGGSLLPGYSRVFANYLVDWLKALRARGVNVRAVAPENEPNSPSHVPAMYLPLPAQETFIADDLAPALRAARLSTQIFGGDVGLPRLGEQAKLVASTAGRDLAGLAWHCYSAPPTQMAAAARLASGLQQIVTECAEKLSGLPLQVDVLGALSNQASAFSAWNLALTPSGGPVELPNRGCAGCRGLVAIDPQTGAYSLSEEAYVLGQVGHFVTPGAVRLATSDEPTYQQHGSAVALVADSGILNVAYRNPDGRIAVITYNPSARNRTVLITDGARSFTTTLPAGAMTTFSWTPRRR